VRLSVDCQRVSSSANPASEVLIIPRARQAGSPEVLRPRRPRRSSRPSHCKCGRPAPHPVTAAASIAPLHSFPSRYPIPLVFRARPRSRSLARRPRFRRCLFARAAPVPRTLSVRRQARRRHRHARRHRPARRRAVQRTRARAHARARGAVQPGQVVPGPELLQRLGILQQDRRPHPRQRHVRPHSAPAGVYTVGG
jgi:hypothetical protein